MFDIGWSEILVIAIVMVVVVGPKDLPRMLRAFGRATRKFRAQAGEFRRNFDEALKEAELDDVQGHPQRCPQPRPKKQHQKALNPLAAAGEEIKASMKGRQQITAAGSDETVRGKSRRPSRRRAAAESLFSGRRGLRSTNPAIVDAEPARRRQRSRPRQGRRDDEGVDGKIVQQQIGLDDEDVHQARIEGNGASPSKGAPKPRPRPPLPSAASRPAVSGANGRKPTNSAAKSAEKPAKPGPRRLKGGQKGGRRRRTQDSRRKNAAADTGSTYVSLSRDEERAELDKSAAPLMDHLIELRTRLIWSIAAFLPPSSGCFFFAKRIFNFLVVPYRWAVEWSGMDHGKVELIYTAPQEFFFTQIKVAMFAALVISFPVIATQIYRFVAPGLYRNERMAFLPFLIASPILFLMGATLVYLGFTPVVMSFFLGMQQLGPNQSVQIQLLPRVSEYLGLIMTLMLSFGLVFQLPVVTTLLTRVGIISSADLRGKRKYAIVFAFIIAAVLTPPDPVSQMSLALPTILLYEVSIWAARLIEKRRASAEAEAGTSS